MNVAQVGAAAFDEASFYDILAYPNIIQNNPSPGRMRSQFGFGHPSARTYTRGYLWTPRQVITPGSGGATIDVSSSNGDFLGKIRTDIQYPIVNSMEFTDDVNGSADFVMRLSKLPEFEILPMSMVTIRIADTDFNWYRGMLTVPDRQSTKSDTLYEFKGFGLRRYLETLRAFTTYEAGLDITEIIQDIAQNWIQPYCPIGYNESKIFGLTGVVNATDINLGNYPLSKILDTFSLMGAFDWSVDGDGDFSWQPKSGAVRQTWFIGYSVNDFQPKDNFDAIKNAIFIQRQEGLSGGGSGWAAAGLFVDQSSIHKYGRNEETIQVPGYFGEDDIATIGNARLAGAKDPQTSAMLNGFEVFGAEQFIRNGNYRIISPLNEYTKTEQDVDSAALWSLSGGGDLSKFDDNQIYVFANGGVRFEFTHALNAKAQINLAAKGIIKTIEFYLRANQAGSYLTIGIGKTNASEYTFKPDIPLTGKFFRVLWDVSEFNLTEINKFAMTIDQDFDTVHKFWIDKIDFTYSGNETFILKKTRAKYKFSPGLSVVNVEFGPMPKRMDEYVAGLQATVAELRATQETDPSSLG